MSEDFSAGCGEGFVNPEQRSELSVREQMAQTYAQLVAQRGAYWWYAVREFVLERMRLHQGGKLYDAGCGVGLYTLAIAERFAAVEIFAVDFSPASLQQLRQQLDSSSVGTRVQLFCADITHFLPPAPCAGFCAQRCCSICRRCNCGARRWNAFTKHSTPAGSCGCWLPGIGAGTGAVASRRRLTNALTEATSVCAFCRGSCFRSCAERGFAVFGSTAHPSPRYGWAGAFPHHCGDAPCGWNGSQ
jgi:SAM-dependent methyltransferase